MTILVVALGAAIGAPARYILDQFVQSKHDSVFPWGTLLVNVLGSFVLGATAAATLSGSTSQTIYLLVGTGLCGALTTFSSFAFETVRLLESGSLLEAGLNAAVSIVIGLAAAAAGWWLAGALW